MTLPLFISAISLLFTLQTWKEDGKWVTLKRKFVQIWDNTSDKITQTSLIGDETGIIKFIIGEYKINHGSSGGALFMDIKTWQKESMIFR